MRREFFDLRDAFEEGGAHQRRLKRTEANARDAVDAVHRVEQIAEALARVRAEGRGLDAGQHHLAHARVGECARLGDDIGDFLGADMPARVRNLAVGAAVVAAVFDFDIRARARRVRDAHGFKACALERRDFDFRDFSSVEQFKRACDRAQLALAAANIGDAVDGGDRLGRHL